MTALDNMGEGSVQEGGKSRLSLRQSRKRSLNSDISPAPEPRTSHRFRTSSTSDSDDRNKTPPMLRKMSLGRNATTSSGRRTAGGSAQSTGGSSSGVGDGGYGGGRVVGVCPLANMGNTCFLNSVLYALRFLPGDQSDGNLEQRIQFLSELHRVFVSLGQEERSSADNKRIPAFQPYEFLEALRVVNPMFEGNRQQDAHELLHCLLDQLCHLPQDLRQGKPNGTLGTELTGMEQEVDLSPPEPKRLRRRSERIQAIEEDSSKAVDVVGSKFVGRMCLETCCSECEQVTGREENFLEVCVPVKTKADFDVFMSALCEEECLRDNNKYWCDHCFHHNEARRSVHYSQLPHHLVIHVKRFSSYHRNMFTAKCSEAMPAPLELSCFCRGCLTEQIRKQSLAEVGRDKGPKSSSSSKPDTTPHLPYHLTAVVCHLGATLSSGHYLSFVRLSALHSSACPEQQVQNQTQPQPPNTSKVVDCQWMKCCGLQLSHIRPHSVLNGHIDSEESRNMDEQESMWLECDDDKIKLVSASEVSDMMRTTIITPYLLFYSRL
ncbi:Ubiquitin carboxyl-terminal hydrolase 12A-like [Homarus americanus]|uniref:Ubiquitin carboxyl-terminal hydrolase 12A-like n=1 Tax=Homarus americanus TaxID=6706 RepID=A0A8J5T7F5_HOMAM|nr:Ubiquitin carboxyl-terminal hydrolase 12A-like [Homarus americanus]